MADIRETTTILDPKFDTQGLLTAIVTDHRTGGVLMVAHMNAEALATTQATQVAHFWSRSRGALWRKGETSGNELRVVEMRIDCDQDAIWIIADPVGPVCHTGARSCFYRRIDGDALVPVE
ncbi:MAG: phosphoribosyl-AMP cyclohydrolase [Sphingomonas sp.]|jgi:phosphoribosyl-AMP cyclohydrolase